MSNTEEAFSKLDAAMDILRTFTGGRPVAPLGALAPSPIIDGNGAPAPARTTPFREAGGPPPPLPPRENLFALPPSTAPLPPLKPLWENGPENAAPTERLSTDGIERFSYETSSRTDACGGPVWDIKALGLSPEAEKKIAQHLGVGPWLADALKALRTIAIGDASAEQKIALAHNFLTRVGQIEGPLLRMADRKPVGMTDTVTSIQSTVVQVSHTDCALLVVTSSLRPKVGDFFVQEEYRGTIVRVLAKDQGYDITVEGHGTPRQGTWTIVRPNSAKQVDTGPTE